MTNRQTDIEVSFQYVILSNQYEIFTNNPEFLASIVQLTEAAHQSLKHLIIIFIRIVVSVADFTLSKSECKLHYCVNFMTDCARNIRLEELELMLISADAVR